MRRVITCYPRVNTILDLFTAQLGRDKTAYRNHIYRTLNYYACLAGPEEIPEPMLIAATFHDIGIWTAKTLDYLAPSFAEARRYLDEKGLSEMGDEVRALIEHHHKLRHYRDEFAFQVENYRRADLVDLSLGVIRFSVPRSFVASAKAAFPNAGFHRRLVLLIGKQFVRQPWRPLPMLRW